MWRIGEIIDGRYEVVELAGRGEMGEVYQVRHRQWNMDLAAKIPRADAWLSPQELRQFAAEAQTWVSLGLHPNICSCHFVRQIDGVPVVFAEYVPDGSLHHWIADRRIYKGSDAALRILDVAIQLAWGLGYAHQRHLVHQDVKPENVMIDLSGDDFAVKVTDFGLARARSGRRLLVAGSDIDMVSTGGLTPPYASPEQTDCRPLTHRTDVYSYAVSLLEILLTERHWAKGTDAPRYLAKYRPRESVSPAPRMPAELTELLGRCLEEDPDERPSSMAEIGDELKEIYRAMSGTTYRREMPDAANLMADELNNRALSMLDLGEDAESDSLFAEALTADPRNLAATYNSGLVRWRRGAITDTDLLAEIEALRADSDDPQQVGSLIGQVHEERGVTSPEGIQAADSEWPVPWPAFQGMETVRRRHDPQGAEVARDVAMSMPQNPRDLHRLNPHDDAALALTPDGRLVLSGTWDGKIRLWDVRAGRCLTTLDGHHEEIQAVDLTPDGRFALSADEAGVICFWDLTRSSKTPRLTLTDPARTGMHLAQISLSSGGGIAFWASAQGSICMLDTSNGKKGFSPQRHGAQARAVQVSPRTRWLLSSGWETDDFRDRDDTVRVWDLRSGKCRHVLRGHSSWVTAMTFRADERFAVTGSHDRTIRIWDLADGTCVHTLRGHTPDALALSDDGRHLLSGDAFDGTVRFWDVETGRCARTFPGHENGTVAVHLEPDGHTGLSIGHDRTVRRWSLPARHDAPFQVSRPRSPSQMNLLDARVRALTGDAEQAMADGRYSSALDLLTQARAIPGRERHPWVVRAWRALESHCTRTRLREAWSTRTMAGHAGGVDTVDISPVGRIAVSGGGDGSIRVWELDTGACSRILDGHTGRVESVCLHPDADRLLSSSRDGTIRLWDMGTGECLRVLESGGSGTDTARARFAADGQQAVVADPSGDLRLWDLKTGDLVRSMRTSTGRSLSVAADGRLAAYARGDRAELWDLRRGACVRSLGSEFLHSIHAVCISANGGLALTAETEGIRLWDTTLGNVLRTFSDDDPLADGPVRNTMIAITADGRYAVSAGYSSCTVLWDLAAGHRMRELDGFERGMTCLAITPDGTRLVSGTHSGTLRLWELDWELDASQPPSDSPAAPAWTWDPAEDEVPADEPADEGRVLLIGFRPEQGQLIVARNNPDLARYVVVVIPGAGASPERLSELTERAEFLHHQLTGLTRERMSVVTWMDYQAPATTRDARHAAPAAEGAIQLTEFIAGLRVTSQLGDRARITVIAHGYGGLVAGLAARDHSLDVDALVFLSCASAGVASAGDLHVTGPVYATSPDLFGDGTPDDVHGPRPDSLAFGATVLRPTPLRYGDDPMVPYLPSVAEIILGLGLASGAGASAR